MNKWMVLIFLLCIAGLTAPLWKEQDAKFYFERGSENAAAAGTGEGWLHRWQLRNARSDFSHAIRLNPQFAEAYAGRAALESRTGDQAGAIKDCTTLIEMNPEVPENYLVRADAEAASHDFAAALKDYAKVIALTPDNRAAYRGRMFVRESQNDFEGAVMERVRMMEETVLPFNSGFPGSGGGFGGGPGGPRRGRTLEQLNRALGTNTNFAWGYFYRGVIKGLSNNWASAMMDLRRCDTFSDGNLKDNAAIQIWLIETRMGDPEKARQDLRAYCQSRAVGSPTDWPMPITRFLLNETDEKDFRAAVSPSDTGRQESEFWYFTGMKHLLAGDRTAARDCLQKSLATKKRTYAVAISAMGELRKLQ